MRITGMVGKLLLLAAVFLTACSTAFGLADPRPVDNAPSAADINAAAEQASAAERAVTQQPTETASPDIAEPEPNPTPVPDPTGAPTDAAPQINPRVEVPDVFVNWLLPWDGIRPVYNPEFVGAAEAPLQEDELIIGVSLNGEAKAYPITVLRFREMVNDELAGIPTLVTW